ncbi:signal peptidase II [Paenibacillus puerhi]|uniref:signal peptidase II n=1 Tax=Paenibacillus puerhi TaxID=2692622 RepID=UPI00135BFBB7|nr:signal peptidase II [Paenibacillus puerhi]
MRFYVTAAMVLILDQASKLWVRMHMELRESFPVWGDFLSMTYYRNSGAAGSTFQGYGRYFIIPAILFVLYVWLARRKGELRGTADEYGSALLVGGAVGNAVDRALFGWVTDFIDYGRGILNVADHAINAGVLLMIFSALMEYIRSRRGREKERERALPENAS